MSLLDNIVLEKITDQILTPERVQAIVAEVAERRASLGDQVVTSLSQLEGQQGKAKRKLANLISMLAEGTVTATETFKISLKSAESDCERLSGLIGNQKRLLETRIKTITLEEARVTASHLKMQLQQSAASMKKRIIRAIVSEVVITDNGITIVGAKSDLAEIVTGSPIRDSFKERTNTAIASNDHEEKEGGRVLKTAVPTSVREWWSLAESNR